LKKSQKRTLKPLYLSVTKKEKEDKEEKDKEIALNNSLSKKNGSVNSKLSKSKKSIFPTQNYHTLNKSHMNSVLNKSDLKDEKALNNISKIDNSILDKTKNNIEVNANVNENSNEAANEIMENQKEGNLDGENLNKEINENAEEIVEGEEENEKKEENPELNNEEVVNEGENAEINDNVENKEEIVE